MDLDQTASRLRQEALSLLERTGLPALFDRHFGTHAVTGSVRYALMSWPDIDIHMPVEPGRRRDWSALLPQLDACLEQGGCRLHKAHYLDDYVDPHPLGAGLYWGIQFVDAARVSWKADLWGWAPEDYRHRQARDAALIADLRQADRALSLRLKAEARARPDYYGVRVGSMDIYRFAIARAGTTLEHLESWKAAQAQQ